MTGGRLEFNFADGRKGSCKTLQTLESYGKTQLLNYYILIAFTSDVSGAQVSSEKNLHGLSIPIGKN